MRQPLKQDKPARLSFYLSSSTKMKTNTETEMLSNLNLWKELILYPEITFLSQLNLTKNFQKDNFHNYSSSYYQDVEMLSC